jgi:aspartyl-tRNA synthetase
MRTTVLESIHCPQGRVQVVGWVDAKRDHGKLTFIDLRDHTGVIQVVGRKLLQEVSLGDVVAVFGSIGKRPANMVNPNMPTGEVELVADALRHGEQVEAPPDPLGHGGLRDQRGAKA